MQRAEPDQPRKNIFALLTLTVLVGLCAMASSRAQQAPPPTQPGLRVGVYVSPPFVMKQDGRYTGMAIELWEKIAAELGLRFSYEQVPTLRQLVDATASGNLDVAVTNLSITESRADRIDFTHPWYDAGLRIMVNKDQGTGFWDVIAGLRQSGHLQAYAWLALVIVLATILLTLFDRRFDRDFPRTWREGIAESFYTVMSVATSGRPPSRKNLFGWIGRIWQALWLVCGVAVLAYVTSSVTSVMTTLSLSNQISSLVDLRDKTVGVFTGSVAEEYAHENGFTERSYRDIDEAVTALLDKKVAAVIADAPVLEYYALGRADLPLSVIGPIFKPDKYGFGRPRGSNLSRPVTVAIIGTRESGELEELRTKYFGERE